MHVCVHVCVYPQVSNRHLEAKILTLRRPIFQKLSFWGPGIRAFKNHEHPRVKNGPNRKIAWFEAERRVYGELLDIFTR